MQDSDANADGPPIIDLSHAACAAAVAKACEEWGFFQVVNHGVDPEVIAAFEAQSRAFFALPLATKRAMKRQAGNARGFFDDELTKQRRDWKQALDFGVPGSRSWKAADTDPTNANLDGFNFFPSAELLPAFRPAMRDYFAAMSALAQELTKVFALGLGAPADHFDAHLRETHSSYLRLNYYPVCTEAGPPVPLGISPHSDAGFLTVLAQNPAEPHSLQARAEP
jgi:isopenicillin N synthase-like dioxygenase